MPPALARVQVSLPGLEQVLVRPPRLQAQALQASGRWLRAQVPAQPGQSLVPEHLPRLQAQVSEPVTPALERWLRALLEPVLRPAPWLSLGPEQLQGLLAELALEPEL